MSFHRHKLIRLPPNRVWRTYPGGQTLDRLAGIRPAKDSHFAEDWIASTTRATNRGREHFHEGVSQVLVGDDAKPVDFAALLATDPEYFLGATHVAKYGANPQLLVKFLDSGTRLHFQVHPTREYARRVLGAPSGKTEAYHVLGVRDPGATAPADHGVIYVGFQRPPTRDQLRDYIASQNIAALAACFDPISVRPGDTFLIPGGTPHALGAGIFMVEIQEPSDLVVRFEFERAGYVLPEPARFMGRDLDSALDVFNFAPLTPAAVENQIRCRPGPRVPQGDRGGRELLIGPAQTNCFEVRKTYLGGRLLKDESRCAIAIVTLGTVIAEVGGQSCRLETYEKAFLPAGLGPVTLTPATPNAEILECLPPE